MGGWHRGLFPAGSYADRGSPSPVLIPRPPVCPTGLARASVPETFSFQVLLLLWDSLPTPLSSPRIQYSLHFPDGQTEVQNQPASGRQNLEQNCRASPATPTPAHLLANKGKEHLRGKEGSSTSALGGQTGAHPGGNYRYHFIFRGKNNHRKHLQLQLITADGVTAA